MYLFQQSSNFYLGDWSLKPFEASVQIYVKKINMLFGSLKSLLYTCTNQLLLSCTPRKGILIYRVPFLFYTPTFLYKCVDSPLFPYNNI